MTNRSPLASCLHAFNCCILFGFAAATLTAAEPAPGPREIIPFDTGWRFHLGDEAAAKQPGFDDTRDRKSVV